MAKKLKMKVDPIDCEEAVKRMSDFMDNYIRGKAREEFMHHIAECRHCFERIEFEQLLKSKINSLGQTMPAHEKTVESNIDQILAKIYTS